AVNGDLLKISYISTSVNTKGSRMTNTISFSKLRRTLHESRTPQIVLFFIMLFCGLPFAGFSGGIVFGNMPAQDTSGVDRHYRLETTMLGYFAPDGTRNPTLRANKGDIVKITITNGELMVHDIALEKAKVKSKFLVEEGTSTSITFKAERSDTYYCTVPGHRAAGMVGKFEVVEGAVETETI